MRGVHEDIAWPDLVVPRKLFHVSEIVDHTGLSRQTIHNYVASGLIAPAARSAGGHRMFDESVFHRLKRIGQMKQTMTMPQIAEALAADVVLSVGVDGQNVKERARDSRAMRDSNRAQQAVTTL